jgi:hypothetical protein
LSLERVKAGVLGTPTRRVALVACLLAASQMILASPTRAAPALSVTPITLNVVGLDSNNVNTGPNEFPVGVRVCSTGSSSAANVTTTFVWDSANANIAIAEPATRSLGSLAPGACTDAYYTVVITRTSAAIGTVRRFHLTVSADTLAPVSTPVPREIYVERLVSQGRNEVVSFSGPTSVRVGSTVTYTVVTKTATQGYEQLVSASLFTTGMFEIVSTSVIYSAPPGATNDKVYADACGWDAVPTSPTYLDCIGPEGYPGGKAGGSITTVYALRVVGAGTARVKTLIYDYSGSSFHYNSDFDSDVTTITATPNTPPVAADDSASTAPGSPVTVAVLANDSDADGDPLTITGHSTPAHGSVSCTATQCTYTPASGYTGTDSFTYSTSDGYGGSASASVTITVSTSVPAFGVDSPLPVILVVVGLGILVAYRSRGVRHAASS